MSVSYTVCEYKKVKDCSIKCDVYPGNAGAPVAVYIHGGALIFGGRRDIPEAAIEPFKNAGYWVVSIDYRLAPETKLPKIIEDVRDALDWVRGEGSKAFDYDASKMAVIGASAGGYLTLMTGTFERKPKVLVSFYGYGDILGDWYGKPCPHYCREPLVSPEEAQRLIKDHEHSEGSSFDRFAIYLRSRQTGTWTGLASGYDIESEREKIERYCPIHNIKDDYPSVVLLHGDQDTDVPYQQSLDMYNALKMRGLTAELVTYAGGDHGFDWNKNDANVPGLIEKALAFTKACLE
jgi:acetyl esterase/lipase